MLIIDFDRQISLFAPGKCGSTALGYNLQHLTTEPNDKFFRAERLKFITSSNMPANIQELIGNTEFWYSLPVADSYLMYRKLYADKGFKHYVFVREPLTRTISGFETLINWWHNDDWNEYQHNNSRSLSDLWELAFKDDEYDYHVKPFLNRIKNIECEYIHMKNINTLLKDIYNIDAEHVPSAPLWTQGIDVNKVTHTNFTRDTDPEKWDNTTMEINKFRIDCASHFLNNYNALIEKDQRFTKEIELYNLLDIS